MESQNLFKVIPYGYSGLNVKNSQESAIWLIKSENSVDLGSIKK